MLFAKIRLTQLSRFLKGEAVQNDRDQVIWAVKIFVLALLLGLILSPLIFWIARSLTGQG